ncbi:PrgI family protein [Candidatus Gracilibacteria bacterium]|nr:PrgI family protein [Candidatus Gracilibacteria bacterium]
MQYKIPIQIENEDTIIFDLSLRQMGIIIVGVILAFGLFNKFEGRIPTTPLFIICIVIIAVFFVVAKFRTHEMTFLPFVLNLARFRINGNGGNNQGRIWTRGVDSYSPLEIGYVQSDTYVESNHKHDKDISKLAEKLKKI